MNELDALVLGTVQGLTEYLPVSSSGHLAVGAELLGNKDAAENLAFTVLVHAATCLSSIIVFWKPILAIFRDLFKFEWNANTRYVAMLLVADIPVIIAGLLFADQIDALFAGNMTVIGVMWLLTATLLLLTTLVPKQEKPLTFLNTFLIGIGQTLAIMPGLSRAGTTIATGLLLGVDRTQVARFSFLMVIVPVLGKTLLDLKDVLSGEGGSFASLSLVPSSIGFTAAFVSGLFACWAMVHLVNRGKVHYFAFYCIGAGILALLFGTGLIQL
jgi:undecaprenyl-diphosphatase